MRSFIFAVVLAGFTLSASAQSTTAPSTAPWSYEGKTGPVFWGKLDPAYAACSRGQEQSPIDIRGAKLNKALQPIEFHYIAGAVTIENTGHTVQINVHPGSYIVAGGVRYDLVQFHFHNPAEHTVKGHLSDMELHLVHRSAEGKLAVVAIRINEDRGSPNAILATLWEHLPTKSGQSEAIPDMVDPGGLLPADRGYWTYTGSLTAPPCTEGVQWFVFEQEISVSRDQHRAFAALYKRNTRQLQNPRGRKVQADE